MSDEESHSKSKLNDLLHAQVDMENYFWFFYCILFKNNAKKAMYM